MIKSTRVNRLLPRLRLGRAQFRVMPLAPMTSPLPEQGPMSAVRVVDAVIVKPHVGAAARTGADRNARVENKVVVRSSTERRSS